MKYTNRLFLIFFLIVIFISCKKDENTNNSNTGPAVIKEQWAIALNYTATWCTQCGSWGGPLANDLDAVDKVVCLSIHALSDPMYNELYNKFKEDRPEGDGIPTFWIGDIETQWNNSVNVTEELKDQIPKASLGISHSIAENNMEILVKVVFHENGSGTYYLSILLVEDGINGSTGAGDYAQQGTSQSYPNNDYRHNFVVRKSAFDGNAYGEVIISNPIANLEVTNVYTIAIDEDWSSSVYPAAILWKLEESSELPKYKFINAIK